MQAQGAETDMRRRHTDRKEIRGKAGAQLSLPQPLPSKESV